MSWMIASIVSKYPTINYVHVIVRARRASRTTAEPLIIMILSIAIVCVCVCFFCSVSIRVVRVFVARVCDDTSPMPIRNRSGS